MKKKFRKLQRAHVHFAVVLGSMSKKMNRKMRPGKVQNSVILESSRKNDEKHNHLIRTNFRIKNCSLRAVTKVVTLQSIEKLLYLQLD